MRDDQRDDAWKEQMRQRDIEILRHRLHCARLAEQRRTVQDLAKRHFDAATSSFRAEPADEPNV